MALFGFAAGAVTTPGVALVGVGSPYPLRVAGWDQQAMGQAAKMARRIVAAGCPADARTMCLCQLAQE
ncbi:Hypothetical protein CAP_3236 [Chondromyces apiculatus DSM 436]|uniref:Uncharacterized protein n=1 Tax=Chondromyces apiculatus DSM 436 TaxID=1192034 RepID=A0A017T8C7_9BACT|nr:Hypothetical protein CAP_3236 [Chondromyces apiculatus DSM 436]